LKQRNVDTGMGLERTLCILGGKNSVYETDIFENAIKKIEDLTGRKYSEGGDVTRAFRVVLDHVRTATFMIGDVKGIVPSNNDQGYILRRIIRRAVRFGRNIGLPQGSLKEVAQTVIDKYASVYPELVKNCDRIRDELEKEENKFSKTLQQGIREFEKVVASLPVGGTIDGVTAFHLYDTYGFPLEMTVELAKERGFKVDIDGFNARFEEHRNLSHAGAEQRFKGGLADTGELTARLHTATHLMHRALKEVLNDPNVNQKGSNITPERLRFDFSFGRAMTPEEIKAVEDKVNAAIEADVPVVCEEMTVEEAKAQGAVGLFASKYGEKVKVYTMGEYSKEICGGPHASRTGELGHFRIVKEQSSSAGVRRIKAVLEEVKN